MEKEEENIFNARKREWSDSTEKRLAFLGVAQQKIEKKIEEENEKNEKMFERFMEKQYVEFDMKINRCKLKCANKSNDYPQIKQCYGKCEDGMRSYQRFVDEKIVEMQRLMNQCVENAQKMPGSLYEVYNCYMLYNRGFPHLKWTIKKQSLYYE